MKVYTVKKGHHYSNFIPKAGWIVKFYELAKDIMFDESCKYTTDEKSCVNKLYGFQFGLFGVHYKSFRYGWKYNSDTDTIDLYSYQYVNGRLYKAFLDSVKVNTTVHLSIKYNFDKGGYSQVEYAINGKTLLSNSVKIGNPGLIFTLGFYFGGNSRAPHTMHILEK